MLQRFKFTLLFFLITNVCFSQGKGKDDIPEGLYAALTKGGLILDVIQSLTIKIVLLSESIFALFFIIYVGYMYFRHHTFDLNTKKLVESLTNGLLIFIGLGLYIPLANSVVSIASFINSGMAMSSIDLVKYIGVFTFDTSWLLFFNKGYLIILGIAVQATRFFMLVYSLVMMNILYCFGPFAIVFSLLFPDKFQLWFTTFLNVLFIPLTVAVLDRAIYAVMTNMISLVPGGNWASSLSLQYSFLAVGIVCYVLAPWLTSNFVGNKNAGAVLTIAGEYAKKGASALATNGASILSGFGKSTSSAAQIGTQSGKDIIQNN